MKNGWICTGQNMKLFSIKLLILAFAAGFFALTSSPVDAAIPVKRVCVVNQNNQPLLYEDGQGLWIGHNNSEGSVYSRRAGADGCTDFPDQDAAWSTTRQIDTNMDGTNDTVEKKVLNGNDDLGCVSAPQGMKVTLPASWADEWECQSVGSPDGPFPCCRSGTSREYYSCNDCKVHGRWTGSEYVGTYPDEIAGDQRQCFCSRNTSGTDDTPESQAQDQSCPLCFHNSGQLLKIKLQCRKKAEQKTASSVTLQNPKPEQFGTPANYMVDCLGSRLCSYEGTPLEDEDGEDNLDAVICSEQNEQGSDTRRFLLEDYRDAALKYSKTAEDGETLKSPVFITECIMEGTNEDDARYVCTTGNAAKDAEIGLKAAGSNTPSATYLASTYGYKGGLQDEEGQPVTQPILEIANLASIYEWVTETTEPVRSVHALFYDAQYAVAMRAGNNPTQIQRTLSTTGACNLHIDPVGRVFDNHTLEPIPGVNMTLERKGESQPVAKSTTLADGQFSFYVSPGTYKLLAQVRDYVFPLVGSVNQKASSIYKNFYKGGDIIVDRQIVYTDIPMQPQNKEAAEFFAKQTKPEVMDYFQSLNKEKGEYIIQGSVSHPLSRVSVTSEVASRLERGTINQGRVLASTTADKYGRFKVSFPLTKLNQNETIGSLEVIKPKDVYKFGGGNKASVVLAPIMNGIKGFAFDSSGNVLPGATVAVKLPVFSQPVYQTKADEKGYFEIDPELLPPMPYKLTFTSLGNKEEIVDTRSFIAQNARMNTNLSRYYAARPDNVMQYVLGESTEYTSLNATNDFFTQNRPAVLGGLFLFMLVSAIPFYNLYTHHEPRRRK